jgi:hypothetical protein
MFLEDGKSEWKKWGSFLDEFGMDCMALAI